MRTLAQIDRTLALVSWRAAAVVVVMLLFGPALVAHDRASSSVPAGYGPAPAAVDGKQIFAANCGTCHTLSRAGTSGQIGPNLDQVSLTAAEVASMVRLGGGAMPSFAGRLSDAQIAAVTAFVAGTH